MKNENVQQQRYRYGFKVIASSLGIILSALLMIKVYPGKVDYEWPSHVRIEEKKSSNSKDTYSKEIGKLLQKRDSLVRAKVSDSSAEYKRVKKAIDLYHSLKDYKSKLSLKSFKDAEWRLEVEEKVELLEKQTHKLNKNILE
ncbi:MAG: hypothetical protein R8P61_09260 [Bacteroidia bacterium]|nr:hypothetical protein [Bacteroidia bacterium]